MSRSEIAEHAGYLGDEVKLAAYEAALKEYVRPDSVVVDLGAGTGILGLLAARAGARRVYSVDTGSIIATTEAIARANGLADRMVFVQENSSRLTLPEPADVIVCDQIGGLAYDAGVLDYYHDARRRLLAADGVFVPGSFRLLAGAVDADHWRQTVGIWANRPAGFDMAPMFEQAVNTEYRTDVPADQFLGTPEVWASIGADHGDPVQGEAELVIERPGSLNAIAGMFVAAMSPSVELTNCPLLPNQFKRWQNLYPLPRPVAVSPGDRVRVSFDVRPRTYLATWTVEVHAGSEPAPARSRGSTILGKFMTGADLAYTSGTIVPRMSDGLDADRFVLSLVDGERPLASIIDATWAEFPDVFRSRDATKERVGSLLWRHARPEQPWSISPTA